MLFFIVNICFAVWMSMGYSVWIHCLNIFLLSLAMCIIYPSTLFAVKNGRSILLWHILGLIFALIAFRTNLFVFLIWLLFQICASLYCAWEDNLIGHHKHRRARARRAKEKTLLVGRQKNEREK